jgi:intracellular multiplication protein IcmE
MADDSKASRFGNIKAQLSDGSTRIRFFGGLAVILVAVIVGYISLRKAGSPAGDGLPSEVATVPNLNKQPAQGQDNTRVNPAYDQLLAKENAAKAAEAAKTGESAVPVIRTAPASTHDMGSAAAAAAAPAAANGTPAAPAPTAAEVAAREQAVAQQRQEQANAYKEALTSKTSSMKNQVNLLIASWAPKDHASLSVREMAKDVPAAANAPGASTTTAATTAASTASRTVGKAGDTFYVLPETVANNAGSPTVTAVIQNKALKGTRIMGRVEMPQNADGPLLKFTVANVEGYATSQTIDAVAIDPQFLDVDNHYLLRTFAVLGSSFLSGYGDGLLKGGQPQQVVTTPTGVVVQTDSYSTKQLLQIGLGNVGKTVGTNVGSLINKPATVSADPKKAQAGFAIILLSDMTLK